MIIIYHDENLYWKYTNGLLMVCVDCFEIIEFWTELKFIMVNPPPPPPPPPPPQIPLDTYLDVQMWIWMRFIEHNSLKHYNNLLRHYHILCISCWVWSALVGISLEKNPTSCHINKNVSRLKQGYILLVWRFFFFSFLSLSSSTLPDGRLWSAVYGA